MLKKIHVMYLGIIKDMEFEGGQQNMMGFSCVKAVYKHTPYLHGKEKNTTTSPSTPKPEVH